VISHEISSPSHKQPLLNSDASKQPVLSDAPRRLKRTSTLLQPLSFTRSRKPSPDPGGRHLRNLHSQNSNATQKPSQGLHTESRRSVASSPSGHNSCTTSLHLLQSALHLWRWSSALNPSALIAQTPLAQHYPHYILIHYHSSTQKIFIQYRPVSIGYA
jgi:hypothetical protein